MICAKCSRPKGPFEVRDLEEKWPDGIRVPINVGGSSKR